MTDSKINPISFMKNIIGFFFLFSFVILGVSYDLDAEEGMICISGKVDPQKILKKIAKYGKHAELCWIRTGDQIMYGNNNNVMMDDRAYAPYGGIPMPPFPHGRPLPYHVGHYPNYHPYEPFPLPPPLPPPSAPYLLHHPYYY